MLGKIELIVREEMERAGALEISMPIMQPATLWQESGRWDVYGEEMFKLKSRTDRAFCLGPTHEELIGKYLSRLRKLDHAIVLKVGFEP